MTLQEAPGAVHEIVHLHMQYRAYRKEKSLVGLQLANCIPVVTLHILLQIDSYTMPYKVFLLGFRWAKKHELKSEGVWRELLVILLLPAAPNFSYYQVLY